MLLVEMTCVCRVFNLRFIGRLALPFQHCVPVNVFEEFVPHYELRIGETLLRVFLEEASYDVFDNGSVKLFPCNFVLLNFLE